MTRSQAKPDLTETRDSFDALMEITSRPPMVFVEGRGSWLRDRSGKRYLDFVQGWAVNCLGHCPDPITNVIATQAGRLLNCSPSYYNEPMIRLAELIARHSGLQRTFFTNSGAEAIEGAIKLARKWGQKYRNGAYEIITMDHGFHGRTLAAMSASGKPNWDRMFEPKVPGFPKVPLNDLEQVKRTITDHTVAVMLEPIQGEAGVFVAADSFLQELRALTKREGILFILDEIQTGIGRTGKFFGFEHAGVEPDIMALGKGLGGGIPLAALVANQDVCCFDHGDQGAHSTAMPSQWPLVARSWRRLPNRVSCPGSQQTGAYLADGLEELSHKHQCRGVRGKGLLLALDLGREIGPGVVTEALQRGLLINAPRPDSLRFMPALTVTHDEIDQMIGILDATLEHMENTRLD